MTGEKNRFKTTEKLWDLDDKQLKSPQHDAIVLWLMDKKNIQQYLDFPSSAKNWEWGAIEFKDFEIELEVPIYSNKNFVGGYADMIIKGIYESESNKHIDSFNMLIEVKPYIDSFGAVLRQINSYIKFMDAYESNYNSAFKNRLNKYRIDKYCLFTLDDRFDSQFESQNITVLHPPANVSIDDMRKMYGL